MSEAESEARRVAMKSLYDSGLTLRAVGNKYGVSRERVRQIIGNVGQREYNTRKKAFLKDSIGQITEMWEQGSKFTEIAAWFKVSPHWIYSLRLPANYLHDQHGTLQCYRRGCKCESCLEANNAHKRTINHNLRVRGLCVTCRAKSPDRWYCDKCAGRSRRKRAA